MSEKDKSKNGLPLDRIEWLLNQPFYGTNYEKKHNIYVIDTELVKSYDDLRIYISNKSDNSKTFTIVYRAGVKSDKWLQWKITKNQAKAMKEIFAIYDNVEEYNKHYKIRQKYTPPNDSNDRVIIKKLKDDWGENDWI